MFSVADNSISVDLSAPSHPLIHTSLFPPESPLSPSIQSTTMPAPLKAGDRFPDDVKFEWAPVTDPDPTVCGIPQEYNASQEFKGKKVGFWE